MMNLITQQFISKKTLDLGGCLRDNFLETKFQKLKQQAEFTITKLQHRQFINLN
jgi:hypothetical protein